MHIFVTLLCHQYRQKETERGRKKGKRRGEGRRERCRKKGSESRFASFNEIIVERGSQIIIVTKTQSVLAS